MGMGFLGTCMIALIDADILAYSIPFSLQRDGELIPGAMQDFPVKINRFVQEIQEATEADELVFCLTGAGNFREQLATIQPYKGGRKPRPLLYQHVRNYLSREYEYVWISDGHEADDEMAIQSTSNQWASQDEKIICSIDKDLDTVPGWHYRWPIMRLGKTVSPGGVYYLTEQEAALNFWTQMLTGDTIDNILGIPGVGPKKAAQLLEDCRSEEAMAEVVCKHYSRCPRYSDDPLAAFVETGNLLWMCRRYDEYGIPVIFQDEKADLICKLYCL
jgi:DNA polymerase-1